MSQIHEIVLPGCTPEPLMNYLKSLGILRLVSEQVDLEAAGCWRHDQFVLQSSLDEEGLVEFFLHRYQPTPIIGPWAGGSGFFGKDNRKAVNRILKNQSPRGKTYQQVIEIANCILNEREIKEKPSEDIKEQLLRHYRREMPDKFIQWMDTAMVLQSSGQALAPVLGTGGNDGRLDFTQNFMQRLVDDLKLFDSKPSLKSRAWLDQTLFEQITPGLGKAKVGQFSPRRAGGPNATQGMEGPSTDNPWDFVLMMEGVLLLSGSLVRKLNLTSIDKAVFPFTVRSRPVGQGSSSEEEIGDSRGELWLPIWESFTGLSELQTLFAEGRANISDRPAYDTVDFARAVAGIGVDRGIDSFVRYGFLKRSGKAYFATAMDRFHVPQQPRESLSLLQQTDKWLEKFRRVCSANETPKRFKITLRAIEGSLFEYCRFGRQADINSTLTALGRAERELAVTSGQRGDKEITQPLSGLTPQWIKATHDRSVEYEIALALATIHQRENKIGSIRTNIEPVRMNKGRWVWQEADPHVVWNSADLPTNMAAVLARRIMDGNRSECSGLPLDSRRRVSLDMVAKFIAGEVNDKLIEKLLWGLILIDHRKPYPKSIPRATVEDASPLPRTYALLKLLFLPRPLVQEWDENREQWKWRLANSDEKGVVIRQEPRILPLVRSGRVVEACRIAYQRLRSSGFKPLPGPKPSGVWREGEWEVDPSLDPHRLAAALLLPIGDSGVNQLINLVTRREQEQSNPTFTKKGETE